MKKHTNLLPLLVVVSMATASIVTRQPQTPSSMVSYSLSDAPNVDFSGNKDDDFTFFDTKLIFPKLGYLQTTEALEALLKHYGE